MGGINAARGERDAIFILFPYDAGRFSPPINESRLYDKEQTSFNCSSTYFLDGAFEGIRTLQQW